MPFREKKERSNKSCSVKKRVLEIDEKRELSNHSGSVEKRTIEIDEKIEFSNNAGSVETRVLEIDEEIEFSSHSSSAEKRALDLGEKEEKIVIYHPWKAFILAIIFGLIAYYEFTQNGDTIWFWVAAILSVIIILPNTIWVKLKWGVPFGIPYILTMLKTKHFINTIIRISKYGKFFERMSAVGVFLGFGLTGVDYIVARSQKGVKRIVILIVSAILLGLFFHYILGILFAVPALAPLYVAGLISFVLLGLGGLSIAFLLGYGFLSVNAFFFGEQICPSVAPVLPGVPIPGFGVMIPMIAWVSLGIILVIHEASHGVLLSYYKEKIKSVGLILVGIIPMGAFVEQDDESFLKRDDKKQVMVLSAGPASNLLTIPIAIGLIFLLIFSMTPVINEVDSEMGKMYSGVVIGSVQEKVSFCGIEKDAPAYGQFVVGDKVVSLNGVDINTVSVLNEEFKNADTMNFVVDRNGTLTDVNLVPAYFESLNLKMIGVGFDRITTGYEPGIYIRVAGVLLNSTYQILIFLALLSFAVGMFNFMPSDPLDGGRMAKIILLPYFSFLGFDKKDTQKFIGRLFAWLFLISLLLNLLPYVTMFS